MKKVIIIGGGPTGLFCAYKLLNSGIAVDLYDQMSGVGKKFLVAGHGGLNLTHSESPEKFVSRYQENSEEFTGFLKSFTPENLRSWCDEIGVETFVGSSGRVFPKKMKAGEMLNLWKDKLKSFSNFCFYPNHKLLKFEDNKVYFIKDGEQEVIKDYKYLVIALGGASWKKTGSDGLWFEQLQKQGVLLSDFRPMNCGFEVDWCDKFIKDDEVFPIKNIEISFKENKTKSELMVTSYGVEGGGIYALSSFIENEIYNQACCKISIDLIPQKSEEEVKKILATKDNKMTWSNFLRKKLKVSKEKYRLLKEVTSRLSKEEFINNLHFHLKHAYVDLSKCRPIDEAISTKGGVRFSCLSKHLNWLGNDKIYFGGEMLDWSAPTGGYLLQGCFSTANIIAQDIIKRCELE